jgi:exo-beta-1,3-glucanase (GH17 family)
MVTRRVDPRFTRVPDYRKRLGIGLTVLFAFTSSAFGAVGYQLYGIDFSPYLDGQSPGTQITAAQISARLQVIAPYTRWVRTYSGLNGLEQVCPIAHSMGLKCAAGASIYGGSVDSQELASVINLARMGHADLVIVGTESLFRNNVSAATLIKYMNQVRAAAPGVPVTTADTYTGLLDNDIIPFVDVVLVNIYPYFEEIPLKNAVGWVDGWYKLVKAAAGNKEVVISETGWPSGGAADATPASAAFYFKNFVSWARANDVKYFYFEGYDESFKIVENSQGPHFGICSKDGAIKPGMMEVFDGAVLPNNWGGNVVGGFGVPTLKVSYVPVSSRDTRMSGYVMHVAPSDYKVACQIHAPYGWYPKPTYSRPLTPILPDGSWTCNLNESGPDQVSASLVPNPLSVAQTPVATSTISITRYVISGSISDTTGKAAAGVPIQLSGARSGLALTDIEGRYSFYDLSAGQTYTVTPTALTRSFNPSTLTFPGLIGSPGPQLSADFLSSRPAPIMYLQNEASNAVSPWYMGDPNGATIQASPVLATAAPGWRLRASADILGRGFPALIFQHKDTWEVSVWYLTGKNATDFEAAPIIYRASENWSVVAAADMNSDDVPDIILQNTLTNAISIWFMNSGGMSFASTPVIGTSAREWRVVAVADVNKDSVPDLILQDDLKQNAGGSPTQLSIWFMNAGGTSYFSTPIVANVAAGWHLGGARDFNRDGFIDFVFQNATTGGVSVWYESNSQGTAFSAAPIIATAYPGWRIQSVMQ